MKNIKRLIIVMTFVFAALLMMTAASFAETKLVVDGENAAFQQTEALELSINYVVLDTMPSDMQIESDEYGALYPVEGDWVEYSMPVSKSIILQCKYEYGSDVQELYDAIGISFRDDLYLMCNDDASQIFAVAIKAGAVTEPELSEDGYYLITNAEQLGWFRDEVNGGNDINARLMNDIDMSEVTEWTPIGTSEFKGVFDGNGKAINNFNVTFQSTYSGLFGYNSGLIRALTINEASIVFNGTNSGVIVGRNQENGIVLECVNKANNSYNASNSGGLVGQNYGIIAKCCNMGDLTFSGSATQNFGGITGSNPGIIVNCYNTGAMSGSTGRIGGLVGRLWGGSIRNSYFSGTIEQNMAAIAYRAEIRSNQYIPSAKNCYAKSGNGAANLVVDDVAGGTLKQCAEKDVILVSDLSDAFVEDTDNINSGNPILSFQKTGEYSDPESTDGLDLLDIVSVDGKTAIVKMNKAFTYLAPAKADFSISYQKEGDEPVNVVVSSVTMEGDTAELTISDIPETELTSEEQEFTYTIKYKEGEAKTFIRKKASGYWSKYAEQPEKIAKGDKEWPEFVGYYKISTPEELAWFGKLVDGELEGVEQNVKAKAFLANDIICNDTEGWEEWSNDTAGLRMFDCTIGKGGSENYNIPKIEFKGIFDGNGFAIKGLYIIPDPTRENYQQINSIGFIACARDAEVKNLSITESYACAANGSGFVGGIVGDMYTSTIENCSFIGAVDSGNFAGGILGGSEAGNTISQCFADCLMKSTGNVRGHVVGRGWNATVENCYSRSGGMVVAQESNTWILNSYTTANVYIVPSSLSANNIVDCFSLAGTLEDTRVTQLTSEEFADGTLLEGLNSDAFCADDGNKNNGYPILVWQSDLYKAKKAAAKEVRYMLDPFDYSLNRKELEAAIDMAVSAIMNAESEDAVAEAKASAIQALQAFESDASIVGKNEEAVNALKARLAELEAKIELQGAKVAVAEESVVADGKEKKPAVTVTGASGAVLQEGTHYTVSYKDNVKPGIATVTVTGAGTAATESQEATFKILPKKLGAPKLKAAKKSLTVTWKKDPDVTGYQLQYSLKKNFKGAKTVKVTKAGTAKKVIKSLKSKKKYFVRVRSYKQVGKEVLNGAWSAAKNAKVK